MEIVKARKLGARSKIFLFSKTAQEYGNRLADISLVIKAVGQAGHFFAMRQLQSLRLSLLWLIGFSWSFLTGRSSVGGFHRERAEHHPADRPEEAGAGQVGSREQDQGPVRWGPGADLHPDDGSRQPVQGQVRPEEASRWDRRRPRLQKDLKEFKPVPLLTTVTFISCSFLGGHY